MGPLHNPSQSTIEYYRKYYRTTNTWNRLHSLLMAYSASIHLIVKGSQTWWIVATIFFRALSTTQRNWRRRNSSNSVPWLNHDLRGVSGMKCESMELSLKLKTNQHGVLLIKRIVSQHGSTSIFGRDAGRSEKFRSSTFPQPKHRNGLKIRYD